MKYVRHKSMARNIFFLLVLLMLAICAITGRTYAKYYQSYHHTYTVTLDKAALQNKASEQPKPHESSDTQQTDTTGDSVPDDMTQGTESKGEGMDDAEEPNQEVAGDQTAEQR